GRWDDSPELRLNERGRKWSEIILGEHSYKYAYEYPGEIAKALEAVCRLHTLFIVGASLNDSDVTGVLRAVRATSGDRAIPNYVVLPIENSNTGLRIAAECLERFGLQPIFYAISRNNGRDDHSALEHLLRRISTKVSTARRIRVVRGTPFTEPKTKIRMLWI